MDEFSAKGFVRFLVVTVGSGLAIGAIANALLDYVIGPTQLEQLDVVKLQDGGSAQLIAPHANTTLEDRAEALAKYYDIPYDLVMQEMKRGGITSNLIRKYQHKGPSASRAANTLEARAETFAQHYGIPYDLMLNHLRKNNGELSTKWLNAMLGNNSANMQQVRQTGSENSSFSSHKRLDSNPDLDIMNEGTYGATSSQDKFGGNTSPSAAVNSGIGVPNPAFNNGLSLDPSTGQIGVGVGNNLYVSPSTGQIGVGIGNNLYVNPSDGHVGVVIGQ